MNFDLTTIEEEGTRRLEFDTESGPVRFIVRVSTPKLLARWRNHCIGQGICGKEMDVKPGRFKDFCRSIADHFVVGWEGAIKPEGIQYNSEGMTQILENRLAVMKRVQESMTEDDAFFGSNGNGRHAI